MSETPAIRIAKGSTYILTADIITTLINVFAFAFIARLLKMEEMGAIVALTLALNLSYVLSDLGFGSGISKYIAEFRGKGKKYSSLALTGLASRITLASIITVTVYLSAPQLSQLLLNTSDFTEVFRLLSIDILFACINRTLYRILLGLNRIGKIASLNVSSFIIKEASILFLLLTGYGLWGYVLGWLVGDLTYTFSAFIVLAKGVKPRKPFEFKINFKTLAEYSWPLFAVGLISFVYSSADQMLLMIYVPLNELAVYRVANIAFTIMTLVLAALSTNLFPYYGKKYGENDHEAISVGVKTSSRYVSLIYTPIVLGLAVTANPALSIFAGERYTNGAIIVATLCIFGALTSVSVAFGSLLLVYNMTKKVLLINMLSIFVYLSLTPILLPPMGIVGMAIIKGMSGIVNFGATLITLNKSFHVEIDRKALRKAWTSGIAMVLVIVVTEKIWFTRSLLPLYVTIGAVTYFLMLKELKAIKPVDVKLIEDFLGEKLKPLAKPLWLITS